MDTIQLEHNELNKLKKLIADFNSYYENENEWSFDDLDAQREIACEIVGIIEESIKG